MVITIFLTFASLQISIAFKLFGNEIMYSSCRGHSGIEKLIEKINIGNILEQFLNGQVR